MANFLHGRRSLVELAEALGLNPLKRHITAITIDAKINTVTVVVVEYADLDQHGEICKTLERYRLQLVESVMIPQSVEPTGNTSV